MKKIFFIIILFCVPIISVKAISTQATSSILMDLDSGRILYSNNIHEIRSVASISNIMTT